MTMTIVADARGPVTLGVDTHRDVNVAAVLDRCGVELGTGSFSTDAGGHRALLDWAEQFGPVALAGVEGTGSYGAGITRHLQASEIAVIDVDRPNRQRRRRAGKTDTIDAVNAARAAQGGDANAVAKTRNGAVESIRELRVARVSARQQRTKTLSQLRTLVVTAPDELRARLHGTTVYRLLERIDQLHPSDDLTNPTAATETAMRHLAHRVRGLNDELAELDAQLGQLVRHIAPDLLGMRGVGTDTAGAVLAACGDNPQRLRSEPAFAHLCGVAPIEASSGNRQANEAIWRVVMVRITCEPATRAYLQRRVDDGKTKREAIRCLKRYVARQIYRTLPKTVLDNR
jgi:transposase